MKKEETQVAVPNQSMSWEHRLIGKGASNHFLFATWKCSPQQVWCSSCRSIRNRRTAFSLSHAHPLRGDPEPVRNHCHVPLTVLHIMQECSHYEEESQTSIMLAPYGIP
jgi:hypothetical protein